MQMFISYSKYVEEREEEEGEERPLEGKATHRRHP